MRIIGFETRQKIGNWMWTNNETTALHKCNDLGADPAGRSGESRRLPTGQDSRCGLNPVIFWPTEKNALFVMGTTASGRAWQAARESCSSKLHASILKSVNNAPHLLRGSLSGEWKAQATHPSYPCMSDHVKIPSSSSEAFKKTHKYVDSGMRTGNFIEFWAGFNTCGVDEAIPNTRGTFSDIASCSTFQKGKFEATALRKSEAFVSKPFGYSRPLLMQSPMHILLEKKNHTKATSAGYYRFLPSLFIASPYRSYMHLAVRFTVKWKPRGIGLQIERSVCPYWG